MKTLLLIFSFLFTVPIANAQTEVGDAIFPHKETFGEYDLVFNGAGLYEKLWIDMFAGGLYLMEKSSDCKAIMASGKPMAVRLYILSGLITSKRMSEGIVEGFHRSTQGDIKPFKEKIETLKDFFSEDIDEGDFFDLTYQPEIGVVVYKNKKELGVIKGEDFKNALFGIWLSDTPAHDYMKEAMLGLAKG